MTMQSSGPISIGQARNECGMGGRVNAGATLLENLAGQAGGRLAWSQWYGKTNLPDVNHQQVATASCYVDRLNRVSMNFRTGAYALISAQGDHGPHLSWCNMYPVNLIDHYKSWVISIEYLSGNARMNVIVVQQPSPGNDYTGIIEWDDQGTDEVIARQPGNYHGNGSNMNGAADMAITVYMTCTK